MLVVRHEPMHKCTDSFKNALNTVGISLKKVPGYISDRAEADICLREQLTCQNGCQTQPPDMHAGLLQHALHVAVYNYYDYLLHYVQIWHKAKTFGGETGHY